MLAFASLGLSPTLLAALAFGFGAIIGSFLNVVIYRLHTGRSLAGRSHCLSCGNALRWYELIPIVSYLGLLGRCNHCGARFTPRYLGVELLTAVLFALVALNFFDMVEMLILFVIMAVLVVIFVYDLRHLIIPDELVVLLLGLVLVRSSYHVHTGQLVLGDIVVHLSAAFGVAAFFWALWFYSRGRWIGFGDVKLVVPLGLLVGGSAVFSMVVLSFWIGAVISVLLLWVGRCTYRGKPVLSFLSGTLTMKSAVPFAPFLIVGCLVVLLWQVDVLSFFYYDVSY